MKPFCRALLLLISTLRLSWVNEAETVYFLVAEPLGREVHNDSYVLPLSNLQDIEHARDLVSLGGSVFIGSHTALVVANVGPGKNGINRNYVEPTLREWSWHVVEFLEFGDRTIEILDGNPTQLENLFDWSSPSAGEYRIGFWNYTIVRELGPVPLYLSVVPVMQSLQFYWSGVGTNYVYSLEGKESLASTNWLAIPGASWPLKTNHWTLTLTNAPAPFYRVKAEPANE